MGKSLKDNLNSKYIEAANKMTSKQSRRRIVAYVESYDDIFFWRTVLSFFENEQRYFEVMLPSRNSLSKGKKSVLMNFVGKHVGPDMIACIDADYDYLMQGVTSSSRMILSSPYVFHTYVYAIENYQCYAQALHNVCVSITLNDRQIFDFVGYFTSFSEIIYPLFAWNILLYRKNAYHDFTMTDFNKTIDLGGFSVGNYQYSLDNIQKKVNKKIRWIESQYGKWTDDYKQLLEELPLLGVTPQNTYLYIQGHHLFENIVTVIMKKVCEKLMRQRENEIYRNAKHQTQKYNELSSYRHSTEDVLVMLKKQTGYILSEQFRRLCGDIQDYLDGKTVAAREKEGGED